MPPQSNLSGFAHLVFFSTVHSLTSFDITSMSSLDELVTDTFRVNAEESGMLRTVLMLSLLLSLTLCTGLASRGQRAGKVMFVGLLIRVAAMVTAAFAPNYSMLLAARALDGIAQGTYLCLGPPTLDDVAPPGKGAQYVGIYIAMNQLGGGVGLLLRGWLVDWGSARTLFLGEAATFVLIAAFMAIFHRRIHTTGDRSDQLPSCGNAEAVDGFAARGRFQVLTAVLNPQFFALALGYCVHFFVSDAMSWWMPAYFTDNLRLSKATAGAWLGLIVAVAGVCGNWFGGFILDFCAPAGAGADSAAASADHHRSRSLTASRVCFGFSVLAAPFLIAMPSVGMPIVLVVLTLGYFGNFCALTPVFIAAMGATEPQLRGTRMGFMMILAHCVGALSPPLIGFIRDRTGNLHGGVVILCFCDLGCPLFWGMAASGIALKRLRRDVDAAAQEGPVSIESATCVLLNQ
eukprot:NODE_5368_length_1778_cov_5.229558.p1 GENE.NODE_5368_length_1778_cov_5.229558~~NODE_5368_length_1778_cov_5.229558.p1  ORF type:complete len:460 (+),score=101.76 NODE_5368_length_1778_cov_5.229558:182-1561(+)